MAAPQLNLPALLADVGSLSAGGAKAAENIDVKGLSSKLVGLLPKNGPIVSQPYGQAPVINTQYGQIPLTNSLTPEGRQRFLPILRALVTILEKPYLNTGEVNQLLALARKLNVELNEAIPSTDF